MHFRTAARPVRLGHLIRLIGVRSERGRRTLRCALIALLLTTSWLSPAAARQGLPDSTALPLRPILVRVPTSPAALGAPRPIATLSGRELGGRAGVFLEDAVQALPGVQIQNRFNFAVGERLAVRGFGGRAQFGVRGVRVLVDGVPATVADGQTTLDHLDIATIGRVEALRGPGASLYGNAAGGVLHFESREPSLQRIRPEVTSVYGSDGLQQHRATLTGTAKKVGYLISAARLEYEGFRRDSIANNGSTYGAATRNSVNANVRVRIGAGQLRTTLNWVDLESESPGSLTAGLLAVGDRQALSNNIRQHAGKNVDQGQLGISWDAHLGAVRTQIAGYGLVRDVVNPIATDIIHVDRKGWGARALVEVPGTLLGRRFSAGGGIEVDAQKDDRQNFQNMAGGQGPLRLEQLENVRGMGAFAHFRLEFAAAADVSAGLRFDRTRFTAEDRLVTPTNPDDSGERDMDAVSPSFGFTVRPHRGLELFGSLTTSFETPSTTELTNRPNGAGGFNPDLEPQRGTTLEAGVRAQLSDITTFELSAHRSALRDELVPFEVPGFAGRTFFSNAGESTHRGFEASLRAAPYRDITARIAYLYLDARFDSYSRGTLVFDGNRIPGMAPHQLDVVTRWAPRHWYAELRGLYRDGVPVDDANSAEAAPFFALDARLGSTGVRLGRLELAPLAGVSNVFDRTYVAAVTVNAVQGRFFEPGPGRTFYFGLQAAHVGR